MLKLNPRKAQLLQELLAQGLSLLQHGDADAASISYEAALEIAPRSLDALQMLGIAYTQAGKTALAESIFKRALTLNPGAATLHLNYGITLKTAGRLPEALAHQRKAVALQPGDANMHYNLANTLRDLGHAEEASTHYEQALHRKPGHLGALNNLCSVLEKRGLYTQAATLCQQMLDLGDTQANLPGRLQYLRALACDWREHASRSQALLQHVEAGLEAATPFTLLALPSSAAQQLVCAQTFTQAHYPVASSTLWAGNAYAHERIRIAYFSSDFFSHAISFLMAEMLEKHDRTRFEVFAFGFGHPPADTMHQRMRASVEHFIEVSTLSDEEIAQLARTHEIDIAVDVNGYTAHCRTGVFAQRIAPVQVNYLGYPGSMGATFMDYIVADPVLVPKGQESAYSEKILRLPDAYQPNDRQRPIPANRFSRKDLGLPENGFVFCCFNNNFKITPDVFDIWMRLLLKLEGSVLWLFEDNPEALANLRHEASLRNVAPERLVFAPRMDRTAHLDRHLQADLFLDTFHYNAHTTTSDALWAGLPVLSCAGQTFASRVAASLLSAARLPELITANHEAYEALALKLANTPELLAEYKARLVSGRMQVPLFDSSRYTLHLEALFERAYRRQHQGLTPDHLNLDPQEVDAHA